MKKRRNNFVLIFNFLCLVLFLLPIRKLNIFEENYSTLSLTTRGYLYLLCIGLFIGLLFAYETSRISNNLYAMLIFVSIIIGVIIPHHVPYNLQGNLHLLFAYIGFVGLLIITLLNCKIKKLRDYYILFIFIAILIYLKYGMVNTLSEVIVMLSSMMINFICYIKYANKNI